MIKSLKNFFKSKEKNEVDSIEKVEQIEQAEPEVKVEEEVKEGTSWKTNIFTKHSKFINVCHSGDLKIFNELVNIVNLESNQVKAALITTIKVGHLDMAEQLLIHGVHNDTALMLAATNGYRDAVKLLIKFGVDLNRQDEHGLTPLIAISRYNDMEIVKLLVTAGANMDSVNVDNNTALMYAAHYGNIDVFNYLLKNGANPNIVNKSGHTAIDLVLENIISADSLLLTAEFINHQDDEGDTPIIRSLRIGNEDAVLLLVEKGADVFIQNKKGESVLSILDEAEVLSDKLKTLKEKLLLDKIIDDVDEPTFGI